MQIDLDIMKWQKGRVCGPSRNLGGRRVGKWWTHALTSTIITFSLRIYIYIYLCILSTPQSFHLLYKHLGTFCWFLTCQLHDPNISGSRSLPNHLPCEFRGWDHPIEFGQHGYLWFVFTGAFVPWRGTECLWSHLMWCMKSFNLFHLPW